MKIVKEQKAQEQLADESVFFLSDCDYHYDAETKSKSYVVDLPLADNLKAKLVITGRSLSDAAVALAGVFEG